MSEVTINTPENSPRIVRIFSTKQSGEVKIETTAKSWGDLKAQMGTSTNDMSIIARDVNGNRTSLEFDSTPLPEGEFAVLLTAKQQKGAFSEIKGLSYNELRRMAKELNLNAGANPNKKDLITAIETATKERASKPKERKEVVKEVVKTVKEELAKPVETKVQELKRRYIELISTNGGSEDVNKFTAEVKEEIKSRTSETNTLNALAVIEVILTPAEEVKTKSITEFSREELFGK